MQWGGRTAAAAAPAGVRSLMIESSGKETRKGCEAGRRGTKPCRGTPKGSALSPVVAAASVSHKQSFVSAAAPRAAASLPGVGCPDGAHTGEPGQPDVFTEACASPPAVLWSSRRWESRRSTPPSTQPHRVQPR